MSSPRKVTFTGPVLTMSGYGVHSRQLLTALYDRGFDIHVEPTRWGDTQTADFSVQMPWLSALIERTPHTNPDVSVQVTIPNEFKRRAPLTIGVTAGIEVDRASPQWIMKCNDEVDLVIVPSKHSRDSFMVEYLEQGTDRKVKLQKPVLVVPEGFDDSIFHQGSEESDVLSSFKDLPNKNFVFVGLGMNRPGRPDRKNIWSLVQTFCTSFKGRKDVGLILKTAVVNSSRLDHEMTVQTIREAKASIAPEEECPPVFLIHGIITDLQMAGIYRDPRVIAAVSMTHGEGFGLPLIEAAACGLPVMATNWSGHLDFLHVEGTQKFIPFEHDIFQVDQWNVWPGVIEQGSGWATPRRDDVSRKLLKMVVSSDTPRRWADELAVHLKARFNVKATNGLFADVVSSAVAQLDAFKSSQSRDPLESLRSHVKDHGFSLVYTMPMSRGDVFISTGVLKALRLKFPTARVYLATAKECFDIVDDLKIEDGSDEPLVHEVIEWQPWMQECDRLESIFDLVFMPNMAVQMRTSSWIRRGTGRRLIDEFASQCGVDVDVPATPLLKKCHQLNRFIGRSYIVVHSGGQKSARSWTGWKDLIFNLRREGITVVQVGAKDDVSIGKVDLDLRGKTDHQQLSYVLANSICFIGIDSYPMHVASTLVPVVALFGSSYPQNTGPRSKFSLSLIETEDRKGCDKACYKDVCSVNQQNPCINNISPSDVFLEVMKKCRKGDLCRGETFSFVPWKPRIGGYTHLLNAKDGGYPFVESIRSMLEFCDEVVVVDGGSTDGTLEVVRSLGDRVKVFERPWDPDEPGMDGLQKAFGRAMVSSDVDFLWQQDADEIADLSTKDRITDICRSFPTDVDVIHLPIVELWGDDRTCRTDRHAWKWRLSRNNPRITHGIHKAAQVLDEKTGRLYAKQGMSDGCEMIDMTTSEPVPHRGFYSGELESLRRNDPDAYGVRMNDMFGKLPIVWHYSWVDLARKVRTFRDFWDKQWQTLYRSEPSPRFPGVITEDDVQRQSEELRQRGGEHGKSKTFQLSDSLISPLESFGS